ncbi:MAG: Cof-type HAD-IIB family hydrolase [Lachnospiraceae bacterium]|nr:Cof-type HAD-IIB family hydrolase [Lachnospiraceae bacterium]
MRHKILVLDIDGTLTNSNKEVTPATKNALYAMQAAGNTLVIASGRPTAGIEPIAEECRLGQYGGYVISYNGARIVRYSTGEIIYNHTLPQQFIPQIYEIAKEKGVGMITYDPQDNVITGTRVDKYMELEARINRREIFQTENFIDAIRFPVNKCLISGEPEVLAPLTEELKKRYYGVLNIYRSEPFFLEIMPPLVDKAHALERLLPSLGLTSEECICCGDGYNDITMLQYAGIGVAMENAQREVKEAADVITISNDEDGLVPVIVTYFLNE